MTRQVADDAPNGRDEEAADWCMRLADEPLTRSEQAEFDVWLEMQGNREALDDAVLIWESADRAAEKPELIHIRTQALESFREANSRRWSHDMSRRWYWPAGLVASLVLLVLLGVALLREPVQIYETGTGERRIANLEDGSRLSLDAATRIEVAIKDDRRELQLISGRAKFDVAKDPLRPFSVRAGDKLVVATGTSFSVELLDNQVRVLLYEGHVEVLERRGPNAKPHPVRFRNPSDPDVRVLSPGRELIATIAEPVATLAIVADVPSSLAWEGGQLSFEQEPLGSAVERMNRYSLHKVVIGDATLAGVRINGVFAAGDMEAFVEGITALNDVKAIAENEKVILTRAEVKKQK